MSTDDPRAQGDKHIRAMKKALNEAFNWRAAPSSVPDSWSAAEQPDDEKLRQYWKATTIELVRLAPKKRSPFAAFRSALERPTRILLALLMGAVLLAGGWLLGRTGAEGLACQDVRSQEQRP